MSEMDIHAEFGPGPDDQTQTERDDPEVPAADAAEQSVPLTDPEPDRETVPVDEDEYR
ncbi:MAG TPA: hypothetical protein VMW94_08980 [Actinomycetes bacterium]|nr:hypothetical protein [Actinomycetes bacterium]